MTEVNVPVRTEIPAPQYRALVELARQHRTTVGSLVRECVRRQLINRPEPVRRQSEQRRIRDDEIAAIRELYAEGLSDGAIGLRLGISRSTISYRREALGLPALFPGRPKTKTREEVAS